MNARAQALHGRGLAAAVRGQPKEAVRLLRSGLRALGEPADPAERSLAAKLLASLAAAEVHLGDHAAGFALLDQAETLATPAEAGVLRDQRGLLLLMVGRLDEAQRYMDEAVPLLRAAGDQTSLARGLLNRAMLHDLAGRVRMALTDLDACERVAQAADLPRIVAKAQLNRGHCETLLGDIPAALRSFDVARSGLAVHAPDLLASLAVDRARALLVAGLAREAATELDAALAVLADRRPTHERAETELVRAQTALAQGELTVTRQWARRAERSFRRRGNQAWAELAVLTRLRAEFLAGRSRASLLEQTRALADRLAGLALPYDAEHAELLAASICVALKRFAEAEDHLAARRTGSPTTETKLARRLVKARLHAARGAVPQTYAEIRAGLMVLRQHRERFGSIDFQTGSATLGVRLAELGLSVALRHSAPSVVFNWLERCRAQAFRLRPVFPTADDETTDAVAQLRRCALEARAAQLTGSRNVALEQRCAELERSIRSRGWTVRGRGTHTPVAFLSDVVDELRGAGSTLVTFVADGPRLRALVADHRAPRLVDLGDLAVVREAVIRLRSDLDALCGRRLRPALAQVVSESAHRQLAVLADSLMRPLHPVLGDRDLVIVPTGPLSAVPWGLLPQLRGRPVTVAPSATQWLAGRTGGHHAVRQPLLVAGPDLHHAVAEVTEISRVLPNATVLSGPEASVRPTLAAANGRDLVHFAAHGHHEEDNVLFSRLDLADGPLMAYDIHQLGTAPHHVVLSSCDIGRTVVRSGDELLGFTAALLYSGTRTVVAGVARLPDDATTSGVMARYHHGLVQGVTPAAALAAAVADVPFMPLVCFGSG
ncbi:CHAT domain-containing protein [Lentzea rhizosphaerae]|uniref:CHAT domain-containing protein n=1 Tax=Lentzea rhizosphaerae TaxID=2041025 RepID=A0ABV8BMA3_9PSEU